MRASVARRRDSSMSAVRSVSMKPGAMAFTRTPLPASSFDKALVSCATPPLLAVYAATFVPPTNDVMDASRTI